ncbi:MAG: metallopeptidase [Oscillospiraceae bacterium]|nr:metallopeptidase [Oscillospiraceae bacterium]
MWEDLFDAADSRDEKAAILAAEILTLSRNLLLVNFRFLDRAIANIRFVQHPDVTFATDGRNIYYSPWFVLSMYRTEQTSVVRSMLHSMLHCVFRHNFIGESIDRSAWNLAADVAVENAINELNTETVRVNRQKDQELLVKKLRSEVPVMTAERIFHYLIRNEYSDGVMDKERVPFVGDDHAGWYSKGAGQVDIEADIDLEELWEEISKRMQTELEVVMGNEDALTQNLRDINRTRYDYTEFLRHFGVHGEVMHLSDEEFDINYYTYGMDHYGNIPLIEPLEYKDERKIRDFVIAIDTSGSVKGEVVEKFVRHTHDILARQESFETRMNLYIIQCDDRIEDVAHITSADKFEEYLRTMEIRGLGETDFRPVFAYVNQLIVEKKLTDLRGLLYFTDGKGVFPAAKPDYDVAFIIHDDGFRKQWVPDWAMKLYLEEEEILDERFGH